MSNNMFVSNRDIVVATTLGIAIKFKKGEPTYAPRAIHSILIEKGILPVDDDGEVATEVIDKLTEEPAGPKAAPEDSGERADLALKAIRQIVKRNNSKDFSAGTPSAQAVSDILGWRMDQKEVRAVWVANRSKILGQPSGE